MKLLVVLVAVLAVSQAKPSFDDHVDRLLTAFKNDMRTKRGIIDSETLNRIVGSIKSTLEDVKDKIETGVDKSRDYLEAKYSELKAYVDSLELDDKYSEVVGKVKTVLSQLEDQIAASIAKRHLEEAFENLDDKVVKRALIDLHRRDFKEKMKVVWGKVKNQFGDLGEWLKEQLKDSWEKVKPEIEQIKEMAEKVLSNAVTDISDKVMEQATKLFNKYKDELGPMIWAKIEQKFKDVTGKDAKEVVDQKQGQE
ncbi:uncharacterized protein LOC141912825 [Tubulanus polymorphus]|uniref:uncharacterized protein LOC141912825 n=1 Tax=Tubulanus polymorphus TaxID=672921 RepID=UPI003DA455F9